MVHEFIDKIVVSKPEKINGKRHQHLDIYYNGIGIIDKMTPDEFATKYLNGEIHRPQLTTKMEKEKRQHSITILSNLSLGVYHPYGIHPKGRFFVGILVFLQLCTIKSTLF